jgi:hypothetical protein
MLINEIEKMPIKSGYSLTYGIIQHTFLFNLHVSRNFDGLFERIEKESEDVCLYKRIFLDYTYGIGKIYTAEETVKAKQSPLFEREYNLKYLDRIGNVFHTGDIETAIEKDRKYDPDAISSSYFTSKSMGIDPAYDSSAFGIVVTQWVDNY